MEDELDESINELFVQEMVDPRIESAMPILSRLKKPVAEMAEIDSLAEWADSVINEKLDLEDSVEENFIGMDPQAVAEEELSEGPFKGVGKMMMKHKLKKGIEKDEDKTYDALDKMFDKDFSDEKRFDDEKDFTTSFGDLERKRKALDRLSREKSTKEVDEGLGDTVKKGIKSLKQTIS